MSAGSTHVVAIMFSVVSSALRNLFKSVWRLLTEALKMIISEKYPTAVETSEVLKGKHMFMPFFSGCIQLTAGGMQ